jgi:hypothetical protein
MESEALEEAEWVDDRIWFEKPPPPKAHPAAEEVHCTEEGGSFDDIFHHELPNKRYHDRRSPHTCRTNSRVP